MSEPRPLQQPAADRPPAGPEAVAPPSPFLAAPTDNAPTVISRSLVRPATTDDALNNLRGRRLAHFELLEAIGVGGMAAVLRARDTQLDRIVALKILPPEMAADPENVRRFHQEARSAAKLDHENIARVFFCGEDQRLHFIAFEFVEGDNLRTVLERRGRLPVGEALPYMLQISAGLAHAAARGVVHRDIKPSNIIVTPSGRAKLVDMGLARSLERQPDQGLTHSGVTLGTFDYISPEQALEPRDADVRSDIYSLGCTFYHTITGQPPVPEGTAAKKLNHHQNVKPTDPRELAPGIPDEVAMILARMMAKNPRDRYQTPEPLVHDLLTAARKFGGGGDVPEGVLAVEAALPRPTLGRPLLFVGAAAAAVVALIFLLAPSSAPQGRRNDLPKDNGIKNDDKDKPAPKDKGPKAPPDDRKDTAAPQFARYDRDDVTGDKLAYWLKQHEDADEIVIELARDIDVQAGDDVAPRLLVKARKVTVRPKDPNRRPTIRLASGVGKLAPRTALTIDSKDATVEDVRVLIDGYSSRESMAGLQLQGGGRYVVKGCEFIQVRSSVDEHQRLASVVFANAPGGEAARSALFLSDCTFLGFGSQETELEGTAPIKQILKGADRGGQDAFVRRGPGKVEVRQCAFGPHAAAFRFEAGSGDGDTTLVQHCSVMAGRGSSVFYFDDAGGRLEVSHSLFSRLGKPADGAADAAFLVRQTGDRPTLFRGLDNRYYNLDGYWYGDDDPGYDAFHHRVVDAGGDDKGSRVLAASPWKEEQPLQKLVDEPGYAVQFGVARKQDDEQLAPVFQVRADDPALRRTGSLGHLLIGVEHVGGVSYLAGLSPLDGPKPDPMARRTLVVDPTVGMSKDLKYPALAQAALDARPGDVILIRHTGELKVAPIRLDKAAVDLTIQADADCRPVLVMDSLERDAAMFQLYDGKLRLEGLEFRLQPAAEFRSQTVVSLIGDGQCGFKKCVLTLDPEGQDTAVAAATLADNADVMKMKGQPPPGQSPHLTFDTCFVRGRGDLVWSRVSRPFDLELKDSLVALDGNALTVEVAEAAAMVKDVPNVNASATHSTAYLTGSFLRLKVGKDLKALVPLQCKADHSLFVAAVGQAFVQFDGPETTEEKLKDKLFWAGDKNVFAGFRDMIAQRPMGDDGRPQAMTWKSFTSDSGSEFPRAIKFTTPPGDTPFVRLTPGMFKPADVTAGADVQQLPRPGADSR
jgi:hypothetical protein